MRGTPLAFLALVAVLTLSCTKTKEVTVEQTVVVKETVVVVATPPSCHPSYEGVCLRVDAGDYDCAGGSGDGPNYVRGPFRVVGPDVFDLDRDRNGVACE